MDLWVCRCPSAGEDMALQLDLKISYVQAWPGYGAGLQECCFAVLAGLCHFYVWWHWSLCLFVCFLPNTSCYCGKDLV